MITASHLHASGYYTDTETTLTYSPGTNAVNVKITLMPGLSYWSQPSPATLRKWVDALLKGQGVKRVGRRLDHTGGSLANWRITYFVAPITEGK